MLVLIASFRLQIIGGVALCMSMLVVAPTQDSFVMLQAAVGPQLSFPVALPQPQLPLGYTRWPARFALPDRLTHGVLWRHQLSQLYNHLTASQNLSRAEPAVTTATFKETYEKKLLCFMGFVSFCRKPHFLCLEFLLDHQLLLQFFSYLFMTRDFVSRTTFGQHINTAQAALQLLQQQSYHQSPTTQQHIQNTVQLLQRVKDKFSPGLALQKPATHQQVEHELSAEQQTGLLMLGIDRLLEEAQQQIELESAWQYPTARAVHDALLLALLFGHLPSPRESMLTTLQQPNKTGR